MSKDTAAPPPSGSPARRSDATRAAILAAARERFAADGYDRATVRAIAQDARIDPAMVMRYFGSKEGLFAAAVAVDLRLPDVADVPVGSLGRVLVGHFLDLWEDDELRGVLTAMLRVGVTNPAGAARMQEIFRDQVLPIALRAVPDPAQAPARAALVSSQLLGLALTRLVLRFEPAVRLGRGEIVDWLAPTVQRYITATEP
ncbi:TetR family transcriptional regulator [Antribacter sp. KLBMP9083]|uniref:TetR family transcriptional regulator n=1 Tax=Antribacter soli TaxID=2910976 RepID=A0AA41QEP9_9MICO|nr:TetR family transcriptional regulator [Antribacter soli]MCF4121266.1 TetR family transcriptional regulator [Antribacter soli]